jgi:hypothetical protein
MRRLRKREKKRVGEFRLLRTLGVEVNALRFRKYMRRIRRELRNDRVFMKLAMKARRRQRAAAALWHR